MPYARNYALPPPVPVSARPRFELDERICPQCGISFLPIRPTGGFSGGTARVISDKWYCSYKCAKKVTNAARYRPRVQTLAHVGEVPLAVCTSCDTASVDPRSGKSICRACDVAERVTRALRRRAKRARSKETILRRLAAHELMRRAPARLEES